jgi:hypothetical protein
MTARWSCFWTTACANAGRWETREPQYVWTNVELEWEEHHYVEVRYWASGGAVAGHVNGRPILEKRLSG